MTPWSILGRWWHWAPGPCWCCQSCWLRRSPECSCWAPSWTSGTARCKHRQWQVVANRMLPADQQQKQQNNKHTTPFNTTRKTFQLSEVPPKKTTTIHLLLQPKDNCCICKGTHPTDFSTYVFQQSDINIHLATFLITTDKNIHPATIWINFRFW